MRPKIGTLRDARTIIRPAARLKAVCRSAAGPLHLTLAVFALAASSLLAPTMALAASQDVPVETENLRIDTRKHPAKHKMFWKARLPATLSDFSSILDPQSGASLLIAYEGAKHGRTELIVLDPSKWRASGMNLIYSDPAGERGGIKTVTLRSTRRGQALRIKASGKNFSWEVPSGVEKVELEFRIPSSLGGPPMRFCGEIPTAKSRRRRDGAVSARNVPALSSCAVQTCGNGEVEPMETCDDGNLDDNDACPNECFDVPAGPILSRALGTSWQGHADTDLQFHEFVSGDHTVSLRFMPQYFRPDTAPILGENGPGTFAFGQRGDGESGLFLNVAGAKKRWQAPLKPRKWYSLALVAKRGSFSTDFTVYLDGEALNPPLSVPNTSLDALSGGIRIGRRADGKITESRPNAQFYGLIDDVAVFSRALTHQEIDSFTNVHSSFSGAEADLVAAYTFDAGVSAPRLSRPLVFVGAAEQVQVSSNKASSDSESFVLPDPARQETLLLPFEPGQAWTVTQAYAGDVYYKHASPSHAGVYDGCIDLVAADETNSHLEPIFAAASGTVVSGDYQTRYILNEPGGFHVNDYMHMEPSAHADPDFPWPSIGKWFLRGERVGVLTAYNDSPHQAHLHFCNRDRDPNGIEKDKFFMAAFSDYEVKQKNGTWRFVERGIPGAAGPDDAAGKLGGQIIRRPMPANLPEQITAIWRPGVEPEKQIYGATYDEYRNLYDEIWKDGWRLKDLEIAVVNQVPRYTAVWSQEGAIAEEQFYGFNPWALLGEYLKQKSVGRRLHILAPYVVNGQVFYTAVFRTSVADEVVSPFTGYDFSTYQAKYDELWPQGYRLDILEIFVLNGQTRYMATWRKARGNPGEVQHYGLDRSQLLDKYDELWGNNWRLEMIETYSHAGKTLYAGIWRQGTDGEYQLLDVPYQDYRNFYDNIWPDGWRLHAIDVR